MTRALFIALAAISALSAWQTPYPPMQPGDPLVLIGALGAEND